MRQLEAALSALADRGEELQPEVLIARIGTELGWTPADAVATSEETVMVTHEPIERKATTPPPTEQPARWRPALVFGVAAVVIVAGIGIAWIAGVFETESDVDPVDASTTVEIAIVHDMIDAFNRYDAAGYARYWEEGATGRERIVVKSTQWDEFVADEAEWEAHIELSDCTQSDRNVTCTLTRLDKYQTAKPGVVLVWDTTYMFNENGLIEGVVFGSDEMLKESDAFFRALGIWLEANHPDVYAAFYVPGFYAVGERYFSPEGYAEIEPYLDEFIAQSDVYPLR